MLKTFAVVVLFSAISDVVWQALIAAVLAGFLEYIRRGQVTIKQSVDGQVEKLKEVKQETTAIKQQTDGYLSKIDEKLNVALGDIELLKEKLKGKDKVIEAKDQVIKQVISGGAALAGQEGTGMVGAGQPLESIKATVEDTNERVQGLEDEDERVKS